MAISSINQRLGNTLNKVANKKFITNSLKKALKDPPKYAGTMLVLTIVSKDIVNGFLYTYQSATNKKIPEDKRGFIAWLDAMNCIFMVGGQLFIEKIIGKKFIPWAKSKYIGYAEDSLTKEKIHLPDSKRITAHDNVISLAKKEFAKRGYNGAEVMEASKEVIKKLEGKYGALLTGLNIVISALATTALVKRTITPLVTTPLAGWFKDMHLNKEKKKAEQSQDVFMTYEPLAWNKSGNGKEKLAFSKIKSN